MENKTNVVKNQHDYYGILKSLFDDYMNNSCFIKERIDILPIVAYSDGKATVRLEIYHDSKLEHIGEMYIIPYIENPTLSEKSISEMLNKLAKDYLFKKVFAKTSYYNDKENNIPRGV